MTRTQARAGQRAAGGSLAEQAAELEEIYASAPVGLGFLDRGLRLVRVNQRLAEVDGLAVEEHRGRTLEEVVPEIAPQVRADMERVFASGEPALDLELRGATPGSHGLERH